MTIARTICLGFLAVITLGTILLMLPLSTTSGEWNSPIVALFTSTSAVCVTGLIVVDTGTHFSLWGQAFILLLIQIGGLGYMTSTTFLLLVFRQKFDFRQKFAIQESFDRPFVQGSRSLIRSIIATTLVFELLGMIIMIQPFSADYGSIRGFWLALFHSISAWNNAGFSLFPDSVVGYQGSWPITLALSMLIIFGGIGYQVIMELFNWVMSLRSPRTARLSLNFKVVTSMTAILLAIGTVAYLITEIHNPDTLKDLSPQTIFLAAWFQSVTTRTAGFNSIDYGKMGDAAQLITIGLMFIGASPSGTGGGIKTTTLRILLNCTRSVLRGSEQVVVYGRTLSPSLILKAIAVFMGSGFTITLTTISLALIESGKFEFIDLLFECVSAFATVGLSTGITADFSAWGHLILILTMYVGRVGILVSMAAILGEKPPSQLQYPEENLLVG